MAGAITNLTDSTFDEEIGSASGPVLVDFWAEWCGPCKMIAPILEEIADEKAGSLSVAKVNIGSFALLKNDLHFRRGGDRVTVAGAVL